ncbi:hypothetical protein TRFO_27141 [Tritrichomonas foetus]|uniref:Uncharacterized protein n=1 Tax=Tritrichomonas foetus TaxID=1144522 RepID=A0A1J4K678_9EUKA|nr:hypothetical protein TRFO_27141 [Tritrichomonas foetus]|eukprot:OHT05204.1 hypothetical protein TRFO_27141 [Tritrichomonas foetus]
MRKSCLLLENVKFEMLSEESFQKFIQNFDYNDLTNMIWFKLCSCFHPNHLISQHSFNSRYHIKAIPYHQETSNRFCGIIHHLTEECGDNVHDKGIVNVTSSSVHISLYSLNAADLENKNQLHPNKIRTNSWICYDFKEKRIQPTHYSIRYRHDYDKGCNNLQTWVIE